MNHIAQEQGISHNILRPRALIAGVVLAVGALALNENVGTAEASIPGITTPANTGCNIFDTGVFNARSVLDTDVDGILVSIDPKDGTPTVLYDDLTIAANDETIAVLPITAEDTDIVFIARDGTGITDPSRVNCIEDEEQPDPTTTTTTIQPTTTTTEQPSPTTTTTLIDVTTTTKAVPVTTTSTTVGNSVTTTSTINNSGGNNITTTTMQQIFENDAPEHNSETNVENNNEGSAGNTTTTTLAERALARTGLDTRKALAASAVVMSAGAFILGFGRKRQQSASE